MRIVSLLPAATEWVCAFGAEADLVGRSHECDYPPSVQALPILSRPAFAVEGDSAALNDRVRDRLHEGLSIYEVDVERLRALAPDLILTQAQCEVCAVSLPQLEAVLADGLGTRPRVFSMEPQTFKQVLDTGLRLASCIGRMDEAMQVIGEGERRLHLLQERLNTTSERPTVACIEWLSPLMTAGHWMLDVVERAGGRAVLAEGGAPSRFITWEALREADPEVLAIIPCGFTLEQTRRDLHFLTAQEGWSGLRAVQAERVYLYDGNAYFNRPGPRLYRAVDLLAAGLHPALMTEKAEAEVWEMMSIGM